MAFCSCCRNLRVLLTAASVALARSGDTAGTGLSASLVGAIGIDGTLCMDVGAIASTPMASHVHLLQRAAASSPVSAVTVQHGRARNTSHMLQPLFASRFFDFVAREPQSLLQKHAEEGRVRNLRDELVEKARAEAAEARAEVAKIAEEDRGLHADAQRLRNEEQKLRQQNTELRRMLEAAQVAAASNSAVLQSSLSGVQISHGALAWLILSGGAGLALIAFVSYEAFKVWKEGVDVDGDGDVDHDDIARHLRRKLACGMTWGTIRNLLLLFLLAIGGFSALWWAGIVQPFLKQLLVYLYLAVLILGLLAILVFEIWGDLAEMQKTIMAVMTAVRKFFNGKSLNEVNGELGSFLCGADATPGPHAKTAPGKSKKQTAQRTDKGSCC